MSSGHGKGTRPQVVRLSERQRSSAIHNRAISLAVEAGVRCGELEKRMDSLAEKLDQVIVGHNRSLIEIRGIAELLIEVGHDHPSGRILTVGNVATTPKPIDRDRLLEAVGRAKQRMLELAEQMEADAAAAKIETVGLSQPVSEELANAV